MRSLGDGLRAAEAEYALLEEQATALGVSADSTALVMALAAVINKSKARAEHLECSIELLRSLVS